VNRRFGARVVATMCVVVSATLVVPLSNAEAKPSAKATRAKLDKINSQADHLDDQLNKAKDQLKAVKAQLTVLSRSVARDQQTFDALRLRIVQLAASAYKSDQSGDAAGLVSAKDPQAVLDQISAFTQLSRNRSAQVTQFLNAAQLLRRQQAQVQQVTDDLKAREKDLLAKKKGLDKAAAKQRAILNKLGGGVSRGIGGTYTGPASGNARTVLNWAYSKLGTPYLYGGTGPRYDCSGFVMKGWQAAGVNLPRVVPAQYNATRRVARSDLQPGDIVFFDGLGHDGIYVGGGKFIHSPHTGDVVKISSLSDVWYSSHYVGAGRP
jgi:peptidoglycan DL-endopeptidase CwlO